MTESIADRYRRRAAAFTETVAAAPRERLGSPSPCEDWNASDIIQHVIDTQGLFAGFVGRTLESGPPVADDALGAWTVARNQTQAALDDPTLATQEYDGFTGRSTFEQGVDRFLSFDLIVHRWDLARAAGLDETIPAVDVDALLEAMAAMSAEMGDAMRGPGAFGPELFPPDGADDQTRALAFTGRRAW